jgi:hypothetical protein
MSLGLSAVRVLDKASMEAEVLPWDLERDPSRFNPWKKAWPAVQTTPTGPLRLVLCHYQYP